MARATASSRSIFQSIRSTFPPIYSAHIAITDHARQTSTTTSGLGTAQVGTRPRLRFADGRLVLARLRGAAMPSRATIPGYTFALDLTSTKPPALHEGGYIDYGAAGSTYYYSRTRMTLTGTLEDNGARKTRHRRGLVRPPVGQLLHRQHRRLGLVQRPPRRRQRLHRLPDSWR